MQTIKILRSSIKRNPNHGMNYIRGKSMVIVNYVGRIPDNLKDCFYVTSITLEDGVESGCACSVGKLDLVAMEDWVKTGTVTFEIDQSDMVEFWDDRAWLYEYETKEIECSNCGMMVLDSKIEHDSDKWGCWDICPHCYNVNTFDYEYEKFDTNMMQHGTPKR